MSGPSRLHADEVPIDRGLVEILLHRQHPEYSGLALRPAPAQGTDNVVFRLGDDLAVRLPRKPGAVSSLLVERDWLPRLAPALPLAVPVPVAAGEPDQGYPFPWAVCAWLPGEPIGRPGLDAAESNALVGFVAALQAQPADGGPIVPPGRRAGPMAGYDQTFRTALAAMEALQRSDRIEADVDLTAARRVWQEALDAPAWVGPGVWVHRDLIAANLIRSSTGAGESSGERRLSGVIDFGGLAVGDPAGNLMTIFHVVAAADRAGFVAEVGAGPATVARARGWALVQGLEALPYYLDTHPGMVAMAEQVLSAVLDPGPDGPRT